MAKHETDMHRRLREAEAELYDTRLLYREALAEQRRLRVLLDRVTDGLSEVGQFEIGAALRDKREGKS